MTRPLRLEYPGALWHIHNRGVERRSIFLDEYDRRLFLELLAEVADRFRWRVQTYCEMTNHFHLVAQTIEPTLSRGMQKLESDFVRRFNVRHDRVGPLFQGRFKAQLVESDAYLLELARYVVLNPVRAKMVPTAADWQWSSYRALAGLEPTPAWLWTGTILGQLHPTDPVEAASRYRQLVAEGMNQQSSPWESLTAQLYLGSKSFIAQVEQHLRGRASSASDSVGQQRVRSFGLAEIEQIVESTFGVPLLPKSWRNETARFVFVLLARDETIETLERIGAIVGLSAPAVHHMLGRARAALAADPALRSILEGSRRALEALSQSAERC
jgi:putative transposase